MNPTIDLILSHRSIRQFTPEPVSAEQLDQILSAAQSAASSSFLQANSIIRVTDKGENNRILGITLLVIGGVGIAAGALSKK